MARHAGADVTRITRAKEDTCSSKHLGSSQLVANIQHAMSTPMTTMYLSSNNYNLRFNSTSLQEIVVSRLARSPPIKMNRVQSSVGSPDFCKWESCRTMPLIGGFSRGYPVSPSPSFRRCSIFTSITLIGSQNLAIKSRHFTFLLSSAPMRAHKYDVSKFAQRYQVIGPRSGWAVSPLTFQQSLVGSLPDFHPWESCRTMLQVRGFSRSPTLSFWRCSILTSITLIGSQDLDVKRASQISSLTHQVIFGNVIRETLRSIQRTADPNEWKPRFYIMSPRTDPPSPSPIWSGLKAYAKFVMVGWRQGGGACGSPTAPRRPIQQASRAAGGGEGAMLVLRQLQTRRGLFHCAPPGDEWEGQMNWRSSSHPPTKTKDLCPLDLRRRGKTLQGHSYSWKPVAVFLDGASSHFCFVLL
ncbi:hypothetical protein PR048_016726 [Dryococelus australis]|uniref:Uncharacterized protein n=1 Tax=Dryococelus australis TaxID=614101 RepID=A0ABQ9H7I7_9NEOP|nr:hypothetical protein PR048_016726 [Dryococelus australis]